MFLNSLKGQRECDCCTQYRSRICPEYDVVTLTDLSISDETFCLQEHSKFDGINMCLTSDFTFETPTSKKFCHRKSYIL